MAKIARFALVLTVSLVLTWPAQAQDKKIEQAIKHRRAAFTLMSTYFSRLLQTAEGDRPFDARLLQPMRTIELLSHLPWEGFAPGTKEHRAKEDIWLEEERFKNGIDLN
jgi:cytochrome c556